MHIDFKRITLHNFMSFGHAELSFDDDGFIRVSGINENPNDMATSNGSGKSSLWESIIWVLTGETIRGTKHISNIYGDDGTYVSLDFSIDNQTYHILRSKDHKQYKTTLIIEINGKDCSGKGIRESEKLLAQYLPDINSSLLGSVIILGQGLPHRFTNNTPSGRKEVLEALSKSDFMIDDLRDRIDSRKQMLTTNIRELDDESIRINTKIEVLNSTLSANMQTLSSLSKDAFNEELSILSEERTNIEARLKQEMLCVHQSEIDIENFTAQLLDLTNQLNTEKQAIEDDYQRGISSIKVLLNNSTVRLQSTLAEINRLENIKDICPTCGQHLPNVIKPDLTPLYAQSRICRDEIEKFDLEIASADMLKNRLLSEVREKFASQTDTLRASLENAKAYRQEHNLNYIEANSTLADLHTRIITITTKLSQIDATRDTLTTDNDRIQKELSSLSEQLLYNTTQVDSYKSRLEIISKFETAIKRDFRGYLLHSVIEYIENRAKLYSYQTFDLMVIILRLVIWIKRMRIYLEEKSKRLI